MIKEVKMPYPYRSFRDWFDDEEKLGSVVMIKIPIKCGDYNNIVDIGNDIPGKQPETELRALARYLHSLPGKPVGFIEKPVNNRPDIPVIVNPWPGRERVLRGMGLGSKDELCKKIEDIPANRVKPVKIPKGEAPCKEVIIPEAEVDLRKDISRCWVEFNQCLWSGCNGTIIVYDPETGTHDLGKLRAGQYEWKDANPDTPFPEKKVKRYMIATMGSPVVGWGQSDAGRYFWQNYRAKNKPMPAAYTFGNPPDLHMVASFRRLRWPETGDEYEILGGFRGEPVEVVEAETIPGMMVPAQAEWIVEGEFLPEDEVMPPYGEDNFVGYMVGGIPWRVFRVKCITHRKEPWWTAATFSSSGLHGHEGTHSGLILVEKEADEICHLRANGFMVKDVVATSQENSVVVVQMEVDGRMKPVAHYGKMAAMALQARIPTNIPHKYIIVVGPDIDPYDLTDVMWALGTRVMPVSDTIVIEKGRVPPDTGASGMEEYTKFGEQVMVDALIKVPERYADYPPRCEPVEWEREAIKRMKEKI